MSKKIHKIPNIHIKRQGVTLDVDMSRMERNLNRAQYMLDSAVMASMKPFMPMQDGNLISITDAQSQSVAGSGIVYAAYGPSGHYLYEGKTMVDEKTGSPFARKDARKVYVSQYAGKTNVRENLTYGRKGATDHWFEAAKRKDLEEWKKVVARQMDKK